MSNSNFNITKVVVDPTSQEITNLEINGKAFESGGEAKLQVGYLENIGAGDSGILEPDGEYDGFSRVEYDVKPDNLETIEYDGRNPLNIASLFWYRPAPVLIQPSSDYDGISQIGIYPGGLTGYPILPDSLFIKKFVECDDEGEPITGGEEYANSITDTSDSEVEASVIYINDTKISFTSKQINVEVPGGKDVSYYIYYFENEGKWIMMS